MDNLSTRNFVIKSEPTPEGSCNRNTAIILIMMANLRNFMLYKIIDVLIVLNFLPRHSQKCIISIY